MNIPVGPVLELLTAAANGILALIEREQAKQKSCRKCHHLMLHQGTYRCFVLGCMMPQDGPPWGECSFWKAGKGATIPVAPDGEDGEP